MFAPSLLFSPLFNLLLLILSLLVSPVSQSKVPMSFVSSTNCQPQNGDGAYTDAAANNNNDVFMTRHSARVDREGNGIYTWDPLPGHSRDDAHLSEGGLQASQELAKRFDDISISHIVSSPFVRCIQTVAPIAKSKGIPIKVEPGICEVLNAQYPPGFWSAGQLAKAGFPIHVDYEPVMTKSQLRREQGDWEAARRSTRVATTIRNTLDGPILFCGHGASCLGIAEAFGDSGYVGYSSFSHYVLTSAGKNKWQVKASGDVSHLSRELRTQSLESAW